MSLSQQAAPRAPSAAWAWPAGVAVAALLWWLAYGRLVPFSEWVVSLLPVDRDSHAGEAVAFFVYDVPKVLLLLSGIVFVTGVLRSWFSPEKTRAMLAGRREILGYAGHRSGRQAGARRRVAGCGQA